MRTTATSRKMEWKTAASGERAPARTLAAVRASAPVAAKPPRNGATMLPMPCATSSASESCLWPVMPSATTAESSDSIAPSMAMAKAAGASARMRAKLEDERLAAGPRHPPRQHRLRGQAGDSRARHPVDLVREPAVDGGDVEVAPGQRQHVGEHAADDDRDQRRRGCAATTAARRSARPA